MKHSIRAKNNAIIYGLHKYKQLQLCLLFVDKFAIPLTALIFLLIPVQYHALFWEDS